MPEQSLAFAAPVPAYVYQNVFFETAVQLVDDHRARITGVRKALEVGLRFHDTYDVVEDQDAVLETEQAALALDPATGVCLLRVKLKTLTATCDGRSFCIEVRAADSDAETAFSTPITVVKEKLKIVQQPPDVWFKDEGGREKCMAITLVLEPAPGAVIEDRVIPLDVRLLYESGNPVLNQGILRLFPDMRPNMARGRVTISFRIDDVSKNHQGQSFVLEISPERQETSFMFQDIAPTRTSVIAIRSKRNKRKLNAGGGSAGATASGARASPRSVTGTPRTAGNLMMMPPPHHNMMGSPMAAAQQRVRKQMPSNAQAMGYGMMASGRPSEAMMQQQQQQQQQQQMSWSSHAMTPQNGAMASMHAAATAATPMQSAHVATTPQNQQTAGQVVAEWKLAAFEIHPDGSVNTARPIYRCPQCRRMNDMDMLSNGAAEHVPQCIFYAGNPPTTTTNSSAMMYRSQMEGTPSHQLQQQQQQQYHEAYQQTPMANASTAASSRSAAMMMASSSMVNTQQNTVNISSSTSSSTSSAMGSGAYGLDVPADASPKTLAALMQSSTQRPNLTISPYMNKVTAGSDDGQGHDERAGSTDASSPATIASQLQQPSQSGGGNLFASNAFRNQMDMGDFGGTTSGVASSATLSTSMTSSGMLAEKLTFINKPDDDMDPALDSSREDMFHANNLPQESPSTAFVVGIGSTLFNEMTSMGITLDQFDKADPSNNPLSDFASITGSEPTDEDQVYYILARMYTDTQNRKLGLPAFDQFQRMLGFYNEAQSDVQTQVVFHSLVDVGLPEKEQVQITGNFMEELERGSDAVHSLPKYQHNLIMLREDALMYYWSQSLV